MNFLGSSGGGDFQESKTYTLPDEKQHPLLRFWPLLTCGGHGVKAFNSECLMESRGFGKKNKVVIADVFLLLV